MVGSVALALILFDGGLRTRFATFRSVLAPSLALWRPSASCITAALTAPGRQVSARHRLDRGLLVGAGARRRPTRRPCSFWCIRAACGCGPRVGATLEVESGSNDPFAVFSPSCWWKSCSSATGRGWSPHRACRCKRCSGPCSASPAAGPSSGAQPARVAARVACAVRDHRRRWSSSGLPRCSTGRAISPATGRAWWSAIGRPAPTTPWWSSSTP